MAVTNMLGAVVADVFTAQAVMAVGGLLFLAVVVLSLGSGTVRRVYFPAPAVPATA